ncbi:hypothetical protein [Azospirillum largimobile]
MDRRGGRIELHRENSTPGAAETHGYRPVGCPAHCPPRGLNPGAGRLFPPQGRSVGITPKEVPQARFCRGFLKKAHSPTETMAGLPC